MKATLTKPIFAKRAAKPSFNFSVIINFMAVCTCIFIQVCDFAITNSQILIISLILCKRRYFTIRELEKLNVWDFFCNYFFICFSCVWGICNFPEIDVALATSGGSTNISGIDDIDSISKFAALINTSGVLT